MKIQCPTPATGLIWSAESANWSFWTWSLMLVAVLHNHILSTAKSEANLGTHLKRVGRVVQTLGRGWTSWLEVSKMVSSTVPSGLAANQFIRLMLKLDALESGTFYSFVSSLGPHQLWKLWYIRDRVGVEYGPTASACS